MKSKGKTPTPDPLDILFDILIEENGSIPAVYAAQKPGLQES